MALSCCSFNYVLLSFCLLLIATSLGCEETCRKVGGIQVGSTPPCICSRRRVIPISTEQDCVSTATKNWCSTSSSPAVFPAGIDGGSLWDGYRCYCVDTGPVTSPAVVPKAKATILAEEEVTAVWERCVDPDLDDLPADLRKEAAIAAAAGGIPAGIVAGLVAGAAAHVSWISIPLMASWMYFGALSLGGPVGLLIGAIVAGAVGTGFAIDGAMSLGPKADGFNSCTFHDVVGRPQCMDQYASFPTSCNFALRDGNAAFCDLHPGETCVDRGYCKYNFLSSLRTVANTYDLGGDNCPTPEHPMEASWDEDSQEWNLEPTPAFTPKDK